MYATCNLKQPGKLGEVDSFSGLALDVANDPAHNGPELLLALPRPLVLPGSGVATLLQEQVFAYTLVVLAQGDPVIFADFDQSFTCSILKPTIGGIADLFFLHRGVEVDPFELTRFDCFEPQACSDRFGEKFFHAGFSYSFTPTAHAGGVERLLVLKVAHPTEVMQGRRSGASQWRGGPCCLSTSR